MRYSLLLEYNRQITATNYGKKLAANVVQDGFFYTEIVGLSEEEQVDRILAELEAMDPTANKQYTQWLVKEYIKNQFRMEDAPRITALLTQFKQLKTPIVRAGHSADINRYGYRDLQELVDTITRVELANMPATTLSKQYENADSIRVISKSAYGELLVPETMSASCELGKGTKWCTAWGDPSRNMFERYNSQGPLYVWIDRTGDKYQFHWESKQFMDSSDNPISLEKMTYFRKEHPVLKKLFQRFEEKMLSEMKYASGIFRYIDRYIRERWPTAEPKMIENATFQDLVSYAEKYIKEPWQEFEELVLEYPSTIRLGKRFDINEVFRYGISIKKRNWPAIERIALRYPEWSRLYAAFMVDGRWPAGEPVIFSDPYSALEYVTDRRINPDEERIPEAEDIIITNPKTAYDYAVEFLEDRWPEGEPRILSDVRWAKLYTKHFEIEWDSETIDRHPHLLTYTRLFEKLGYDSPDVIEKAKEVLSETETPVLENSEYRLALAKWSSLDDFISDMGNDTAKFISDIIHGKRDLFSSYDFSVDPTDVEGFLDEALGYDTPESNELAELFQRVVRKDLPEFDIEILRNEDFLGANLYELLDDEGLDEVIGIARSAVIHGRLMGTEQEMYKDFFDELSSFDPRYGYGTLVQDAKSDIENPILFVITTEDLYRFIKRVLGDDEEELAWHLNAGIQEWMGNFEIREPRYGYDGYDEKAAIEDFRNALNENLPNT